MHGKNVRVKNESKNCFQRIIRLIRQRKYVALMLGSRKTHRVKRCYGKRQLGRPKLRRKNNKLMFRKTEWEGENCFDLAELRDKWRALVNREIKFGCYKMGGGGNLLGLSSIKLII